MAIVDVEVPSGFVFTGYRFLDNGAVAAELERVDARGSNVVFYFNDVRGLTILTLSSDFLF